jgi:hypothetical protein
VVQDVIIAQQLRFAVFDDDVARHASDKENSKSANLAQSERDPSQ